MNKKYLKTLAAFLCCAMTMVVLTACSEDDDNLAPGVDGKIVGNWFSDVSGMTYAKWNYGKTWQNTDVQGFSELVADTNVVVLDVRTVDEFNDGHIKGAILIDQKQSDFIEKAKATLPIDKKIAIYCRSGRRSANAAGRLADIGYKCVNLKGGIIAWKDAGKPVVTE